MDQVSIKNVSSATVVLSVPELKFRRELVPGRTIYVSKEDYKELSFDPGIIGLIDDHYIVVSTEEEEKVETKPVYEASKIAEILDKLDTTAFAKFLPGAAPAEKDTVVKLAVEKGITHPAFVQLIKKYCDVDIIAAINRQHQLEEK